MKKIIVCLSLFSIISLQAGRPKKKSVEQPLQQDIAQPNNDRQQSDHEPMDADGNQIPSASLQAVQNATSEDAHLQINSIDDDFDHVISAQSSTKSSPTIPDQHHQSSRRFTQNEPTETYLKTSDHQTSPIHYPEKRSTPKSNDDLVDEEGKINRAKVQELEEKEKADALKKQTTTQSALNALERIGFFTAMAKAKQFAEYLALSDLQRIQLLDNNFKLQDFLNTFDSEESQGEWIARGLGQAVESKSIDSVTRMLEIIQTYKLNHLVPTEHQNRAALLLQSHNRKTIAEILPQTQRVTKPGDLSPRSQTALASITAVLESFKYNPQDFEKLPEILEKLKR